MTFIKSKFKHFLMGVSLLMFILMLSLGNGLSAFGMGMESQKFINSVERSIDHYLPKGKVVLDSKGGAFGLAKDTLKSAYESDAISTLTTQEINSSIKDEYLKYADDSFDSRWGTYFGTDKKDIDLNEFSHELVQFDISVAKKFHNYGYTHSGIEWFSHHALGDLLKTNYKYSATYQDASHQQIILDQNNYDVNIVGGTTDTTGFIPTNIPVTASLGTYIVNNKVWFLNTQIDNIIKANNALVSPFTANSKTWITNNLGTYDKNTDSVTRKETATVNDYYQPNFTKAFYQTRIGAVFLIILTPIFGLVFTGLTTYGYLKFPNGLE